MRERNKREREREKEWIVQGRGMADRQWTRWKARGKTRGRERKKGKKIEIQVVQVRARTMSYG